MGVRKYGVKYGNSTVVTSHSDGEREEAQMVSSHFILIKVQSRTSVVTVQARKLLRWGQGVAHGGAQMKRNHSVTIILSCNVLTQRVSGKTNLSNHISIKLHTSTSMMIVHAQKI